MRLSLALAAFFCGTLFCTAALPATVTPETGEVLINRGSGFVRIGGTVQADVGTIVTARAESSAVIVYDDGCRIRVGPGEVVRIDESGCRANIIGLGALGFGLGIFLSLDQDDESASR